MANEASQNALKQSYTTAFKHPKIIFGWSSYDIPSSLVSWGWDKIPSRLLPRIHL